MHGCWPCTDRGCAPAPIVAWRPLGRRRSLIRTRTWLHALQLRETVYPLADEDESDYTVTATPQDSGALGSLTSFDLQPTGLSTYTLPFAASPMAIAQLDYCERSQQVYAADVTRPKHQRLRAACGVPPACALAAQAHQWNRAVRSSSIHMTRHMGRCLPNRKRTPVVLAPAPTAPTLCTYLSKPPSSVRS